MLIEWRQRPDAELVSLLINLFQMQAATTRL